jgi:hypothetical protein
LIASSQQSRQPNYTTGLDLCVRIYTAYRIAFEMVGLFPLVTSLLYPTFPQVELFGVYSLDCWTQYGILSEVVNARFIDYS